MTELTKKKCEPCQAGAPKLKPEKIEELTKKVTGWEVINGHHLKKEYEFDNFKQALEFVNRIGETAEKEGHHPDIKLGWGKVEVQIYTHKIDGLHENDFILAAKIDEIS